MLSKTVLILFLGMSILFSCESIPSTNKSDTNTTSSKEESLLATAPAEQSKTITEKPSAPVNSKDTISVVVGLDISLYQGKELDFLNTNNNNFSFLICKATEGITYTDPSFQANWSLIPEKGLIRGAYHFYRSVDAPDQQVYNYLNAIKGLKKTDLPPIVDFEGGGIDQSQSVKDIAKDLLIFLSTVEKTVNRKPMIYTDLATANKYLNDPIFADYPLWIANYNNKAVLDLPNTWKEKGWAFWQKTSSYSFDDQKNDFDVFNGNYQQLLNFIESH